MAETEADPLRERLEEWIGKPLTRGGGMSQAPDEVNVPMIRHWVDALDDQNPIYLDPEAAAQSRFGEVVAPPAMLQAWTMGRPKIEGIAERGGSPGEIARDNLISIFDDAGFPATLATNSELEFERYLHPASDAVVETISERKNTAIGPGYFVTWVTSYTDQNGEVVGRQRFRILKFNPGGLGEKS